MLEQNAAKPLYQQLMEAIQADIEADVYRAGDKLPVEKELEEIQWEMLGDTPHCACMLKSNPLAGRKELKIEDLKQSDFICISPQYLPEYSAMIQRMCKAGGFVPNIPH